MRRFTTRRCETSGGGDNQVSDNAKARPTVGKHATLRPLIGTGATQDQFSTRKTRIVPPLSNLLGPTWPPFDGVRRNRPSGLNATEPQPNIDTLTCERIFPDDTSNSETVPSPYVPAATSFPSGLK